MRALILGVTGGVDGPLSFPAIVVFALPITSVPFYPFQIREDGFLALFFSEWMFDSR